MRHLKVLVLFIVLLYQQVYGQFNEAETYLNCLEQQLISSDSLINSCRILSKQFVKKQNFSAAIYCAHREANYLQKKNYKDSIIIKKQAEVQFNLAKLYRRISKYDMALKCIQKALFYYQQPTIIDSTIFIEIYFFCAQTQYLQGNYQYSEYSLDSMNRLLELNKTWLLSPKDSIELLILKGSINLKKGDLLKAEKQFKIAAYKHLHSPTVPPLLLSQIYNNLGFIKIEKEAVYAAISYFSKVVERSKAKDITYFTNFKLIYSNLGFCYFRLKKYKKALAYHKKSLRLLSRFYPHDNEHTAFVYNHIGGTYQKLQAADSALYYTNQSIQIYQKVLGAQSLALISPLRQKANLYKAQKKYISAEKIYLQLIKTHQNNFKKHPDLAALYLDLSMLYHQSCRYKLAEQSVHKAWNANLLGDKILHPSLMIKILHQQLKLIRLTTHGKSQLYFQKIKKLDIIIAQSLYQLHGKADKKNILTHLRALCNHGIAFCYDWYNKTKDQAYLERIFELMEYNKSVLLNISIRAQLNDPKQSKQVKLHEFIERKWLEAWTNNDSTTLLNLQDQLFNQHWNADLSQRQTLQYNLIAVKDLQSMIGSEEIIFNYFCGSEAIYVLLIEQKKLQIKYISKDILPLIRQFKQLFQQGQNAHLSLASSVEQYDSIAHTLLNALHLNSPLKNFIIIPDKELGDIPVSALTLKQNPSSSGFHDLHYLIHQKTIGYAYSANIYHQQQNCKANKAVNSLFGVAPSYTNHLSLQNLKYARKEIKALQKKYKGLYLYDSSAHKKNFLNHCADHTIIHLATHSNTNIEQGQVKCLHMYKPDSATENRLLAEDILSLSISPQLVVLNACQTATGIWMEGEGNMSIARDFMYAGAKSVLQTLWTIDDKSSMQISQSFYNNLALGASKTSALKSAQLNYIEQASSQEAHPYYWAAYQLYGNNKGLKLEIAKTEKKWYLALLSTLGIFAFFIGYLTYKKS